MRIRSSAEQDRLLSAFGEWSSEHGLPVFAYRADPRVLSGQDGQLAGTSGASRHWAGVGNRRVQLFADNAGRCGLWDEHDGLRWLTAPDETGTGETGTGVSILEVPGCRWGTAVELWPADMVPERRFGPSWVTVAGHYRGVTLERLTHCPEGDRPWVLIRVSLVNDTGEPLAGWLTEEWALRPRFVRLGSTSAERAATAAMYVRYRTEIRPGGVRAIESFGPATGDPAQPSLPGRPRSLILEALGAGRPDARPAPGQDGQHPVLRVSVPVRLSAGERAEYWFRFGESDAEPAADPRALLEGSLAGLRARLPQAGPERDHLAPREIPWHAALLTGGACADAVLGGHTLNQGSAYSHEMGFNGAARDPLQHALPLVYSEPDLALSVLRNTCSWSDSAGRVPWALDAAKQPWTSLFDPSDQPLWALWLAAEYGAATGDLAAFAAPVAFHPSAAHPPVSLHENLRRQFRYFVDQVGLGAHGHVRIKNADWNDMAITESGVDRAAMIAAGESVLNSAMAAWVLPVWAALAERLDDAATALEARALGEQLREAVAGEWNGQWFRRAYGPGSPPVGDDDLWLEVQPWAILCGAATAGQARSLLATIDAGPRQGSPLGARVKWPADGHGMQPAGEGTRGGIWFAVNMTLVWAAATVSPELAADEWHRMTLAAHAAAYPDIWEGTISGPDSYNSPESGRPGRTWGQPDGQLAMQAFPVNNLHSHAQPILAYLRLLGVQPTSTGALKVGSGGSFSSQSFEIRADGHGRLRAGGAVEVHSDHGVVRGSAGTVSW